MLRDSRIVHIIDLLGELRELLLVIDQAGDTAPAILLKLAKEKAEEITRLTRELRQPEFWDGILRYDPFTSVKTTTHEDAIPSMENPLEKVGEPVSSHITDENIIPTEKQSEESGERTQLPPDSSDAVSGFLLNLRFTHGELTASTGVSYRTFSTDKSMEFEWDSYIRQFFKEHSLYFSEDL